MFRSKMYMKRIICSFFLWTTASVIYYAFVMNLGSLSGSIYLNSAINGPIEIVGYAVLPVILLNCFGRIKTMLSILGTMMLLAICGLVITNPVLIKIVRWSGALADCGLFSLIYTHTAECFPTNIRGQCFAFPDGLSRFPSAASPFLGLLYQHNRSYYWLVNLGMICMALIACLFLPETDVVYPDSKDDCRKQKALIEF